MCIEEVLVIEAEEDGAVISPYGEGIICRGFSERGIRKDITSSRDYTWSISPEETASFSVAKGKCVVNSTKAGKVTLHLERKDDASVSCTKELTFVNHEEYRFSVTPTSIEVTAGDSFDKKAFAFYKELWVNENYVSKKRIPSSNETIVFGLESGSDSKLVLDAGTSTITAKENAVGTALINASTNDDSFNNDYRKSVITVNIKEPDRYVLTVTPESQTIFVDQTKQYSYTLTKNGEPINGPIIWESSSPSVATINGSGLAKGLAAGTTTIRAYYPQKDGALASASATLTVRENEWAMILDPTSLTVDVGAQKSFSIAVKCNGNDIKYSHSDIIIAGSTIVTATLRGTNCLVSGVSKGSTSISVSYRPGGVEKCKETVSVNVVTAGGSVGADWEDGGKVDL